MRISEIFYSIMGESTHAGLPAVFVRLAGCNLRCVYCDTRYAQDETGEPMAVDRVVDRIEQHPVPMVCITGGEPLLQPESCTLAGRVLQAGRTCVVETNGSLDISILPTGACRIVDIKTPGSGMADSFDWKNIARLSTGDEIKIVCGSRADYEWARGLLQEGRLPLDFPVLFSAAAGSLEPRRLAEWMLADALPVRLQLQLHKVLWPGIERGV